ncbi:MAG: hydroxymethylglutaryl-CoA reductase, degradative [Patescibacteria group bacterium]|nr:hydroxymethylglutaryl-CoA reductase, degradative [Patescibacteria group bacterium]
MEKKRNLNLTSAIPSFNRFPLERKIEILKKFSNLNKGDLDFIKKYQKLPDFSDTENNIGPFKIATNFLINGKDYFVPMEVEEPSVVAAASRGAKLIREGGGFKGRYLGNQMVGQVQLIGIKDFKKAKEEILKHKDKILKIANQTNKLLLKLSGGAGDLEIRRVKEYLVLHLLVDPKDAMGANIINTMLEKIAPFLAKISKAKTGVRIVSNFAPKRVVFVEGKVPLKKLALRDFYKKKVLERILDAQKLAESDTYRAVTHNKGVMNGIDAVALATGNDWRATEAAVHSFALKEGKYKPITRWKLENNFLKGKIKVSLPMATVGGATESKKARLALKILGVQAAEELGIVSASVGLANNLSALSVLGTEGIQKGHMRIHREFLPKKSARK